MNQSWKTMTGEQMGRRRADSAWPQPRSRPTEAPSRPVVFILPGLGGEDDPDLEGFWAPLRSQFDLVKIGYLDWTELVEAGCDFAALAANVRRQMESRMPLGPIRMAGYSIGGHLAYHAALAFQAGGRQVKSVAILDAGVEIGGVIPPFRDRTLARLKRLSSFDLRSGAASVLAKALIVEGARPVLRHLSRYRRVRLPFGFDKFLHHKTTMQLVRRIYPAWWKTVVLEAERLRAPTWVFRSEEHHASEANDLGWAGHCLDLRVVPIAGSHRGMLSPLINGPLRAAFVEAMSSVNEES